MLSMGGPKCKHEHISTEVIQQSPCFKESIFSSRSTLTYQHPLSLLSFIFNSETNTLPLALDQPKVSLRTCEPSLHLSKGPERENIEEDRESK